MLWRVSIILTTNPSDRAATAEKVVPLPLPLTLTTNLDLSH